MKKTLNLVSMLFLLSIATHAQEKITMNVDDLNSDIDKYVKKNYAGYKITEAVKFDAVYEMIVHRESAAVSLVFSKKAAFLYKKTDAEKAKTAFQIRTSMALDDVESDITKYIKKNYEGYKLTEAYRYDEVYAIKIMKGTATEILLFDKDGKFVKKKEAAKPVPPKTDTVAVKPEPVKTDTITPAKTDTVK